MTSDLDLMVREYAEGLEDRTRPVSVSEAVERRAAARRVVRPRPLLAVAVALVTCLVIGVPALVGIFDAGDTASDDSTPQTTAPQQAPTTAAPVNSTTTVTGPTSTTAPVPAPPPIAWRRVRSDAFIHDPDKASDATPANKVIFDVVEGGPGLVAVGVDGLFEDADAAVWYSTDGEEWTRVPDPDGVFGGPAAQYINAVAVGGPGLVAVGYEWLDGTDIPVVWTSPDGIAWTRIPYDELAFGGEGYPGLTDVIPWDGGLLAVGRRSGDPNSENGGVWVSEDGLEWQRVETEPGVFETHAPSKVYASSLGVVAVGGGGVGADGEGQPAMVWWSEDGLTWDRIGDRIPVFQSLHNPSVVHGDGNWAGIWDVTAGGPGLVAVGEDGWCTQTGCKVQPAVWTSTDGRTWVRRPDVEQTARFTKMFAVASIDDVLVAVGQSDWGEKTGPAAVWTSVDGGLTWSLDPGDIEVFGDPKDPFAGMHALIRFGSRLVGVGFSGPDAAVWMGEQAP